MAASQNKRPRSTFTLFIISIAIAALMLIVVPLVVLTYLSDSFALVEETARVDASSADKARIIAKQIYSDLMGSSAPAQRYEITLSENDINGIIAIAARGIKGVKGRVNVTPFGIKGAFTFYVPKNPFGDYINLTATIDPSSKGLVVNNVTIGSMEIPGKLAVSLVETLLNQLLGEAFGSKLIQAIESINVNGSKLQVVYRPIAGLRQAVDRSRGKVKKIRDDLALLGDPKIVRLYYQTLCQLHKQIGGMGDISLGYYLSSAFSFSKKRSLAGGDPSEENKAALLALAIFLGSANFDSVIGAIDKREFQRCPPVDNHIVLASREDLRLHFIFSAALKIISDSELSFAIGEFKELLDSQQGGSGFSFVDLAADRAGIRFAEWALDNASASRVQKMASELTEESVFFPSIDALPEGIPQRVFEERGGIESDYYQQYLATINARINGLTLYQRYSP